MDIKNISPHQSFGAKHIRTTTVKEKIPYLPFYRKIDVDFVELRHESDIESVKEYRANNPQTILGLHFLENFEKMLPNPNFKAFAVTRQRTGHEKLDPEKIIGICDGHFTCDWRDGNIFFIDYLETLSRNNRQRIKNNTDNIKGIGKTILKNIIKTMGEEIDSIELDACPSAKSFYRHLGFNNDNINPDYYRLSYDKFNDLMKMD